MLKKPSYVTRLAIAILMALDPISARAFMPPAFSGVSAIDCHARYTDQAIVPRLSHFFESRGLNNRLTVRVAKTSSQLWHLRPVLWSMRGGFFRRTLGTLWITIVIPPIEAIRYFRTPRSLDAHRWVMRQGHSKLNSIDEVPPFRRQLFTSLLIVFFYPFEWAGRQHPIVGVPLGLLFSPLIFLHAAYQAIASVFGMHFAVGDLGNGIGEHERVPVLVEKLHRLEPGYGRVDKKFGTEELKLQQELSQRMARDESLPQSQSGAAIETLLRLRFHSLLILRRDGLLNTDDINTLNMLNLRSPTPNEIASLVSALTNALHTYDLHLDESAYTPGFDEGFVRQLISTHLFPYETLERFQRTYRLLHDFSLIQKALNHDNVEGFIRDRRESDLNEHPRTFDPSKYLYEPGPEDVQALAPDEVSRRVHELIGQFDKSLQVLEWVDSQSTLPLPYNHLVEVTGSKKYQVTIEGTSPIELQDGDVVFLNGLEYEFVVQSLQRDSRRLALVIAGGSKASPAIAAQHSGTLTLVRPRDTSAERQVLKTILPRLKKYFAATPAMRASMTPITGLQAWDRALGLDTLSILSDQPWQQATRWNDTDIPYDASDPDDIHGDQAVETAVQTGLGPARDIILEGPPATRKTGTLSEITLQALAQGKSVLILSERHQVVDNLLKRILGQNPDVPVLRVGNNPSSFWYGMESFWPGSGRSEDSTATLDRFKLKRHLQGNGGSLVVATIMGANNDHLLNAIRQGKLTIPGIPKHQYDLVIIDEAGISTVSAGLVALQFAGDKVIIAGDTGQLSPFGLTAKQQGQFISQYIAKKNIPRGQRALEMEARGEALSYLRAYSQSILAFLTQPSDSLNARTFQPKTLAAHVRLSTNHRQVDLLRRLTNRLNGNDVFPREWADFAIDTLRIIDLADLPEAATQWFGSTNPETGSTYNLTELRFIVQQLKEWSIDYPSMPLNDFGVIVPFAQQLLLVEEEIKKLFPGRAQADLPLAATIDSIQGGERPFIIFGMGKSNSDLMLGNLLNDLAHWVVAASRAGRKLTMIIDSRMFNDRPGLTPEGKALRAKLRGILQFFRDEVLAYYPEAKHLGAVRTQTPTTLVGRIDEDPDGFFTLLQNTFLTPINKATSQDLAALAQESTTFTAPRFRRSTAWLDPLLTDLLAKMETAQRNPERLAALIRNGEKVTPQNAALQTNREHFASRWIEAWTATENKVLDELTVAEDDEYASPESLSLIYRNFPSNRVQTAILYWYENFAKKQLPYIAPEDALDLLPLLRDSISVGLETLEHSARVPDEVKTAINAEFENAYRRAALEAYRGHHEKELRHAYENKLAHDDLKGPIVYAFRQWMTELIDNASGEADLSKAYGLLDDATIEMSACEDFPVGKLFDEWVAKIKPPIKARIASWAASAADTNWKGLVELKTGLSTRKTPLDGEAAQLLNNSAWIKTERSTLQRAVGERAKSIFDAWQTTLVTRALENPRTIDKLETALAALQSGLPDASQEELNLLLGSTANTDSAVDTIEEALETIRTQESSTREKRVKRKPQKVIEPEMSKAQEATITEILRAAAADTPAPAPDAGLALLVFTLVLQPPLTDSQRLINLVKLIPWEIPRRYPVNDGKELLLAELMQAYRHPAFERHIAEWDREISNVLRERAFWPIPEATLYHAGIRQIIDGFSADDPVEVKIVIPEARYLNVLPDFFFMADQISQTIFVTLSSSMLRDFLEKRLQALRQAYPSDKDQQALDRFESNYTSHEVNLTFFSRRLANRMSEAIEASTSRQEAREKLSAAIAEAVEGHWEKEIGTNPELFAHRDAEAPRKAIAIDLGTIPHALMLAQWTIDRLLINHLRTLGMSNQKTLDDAYETPEKSFLVHAVRVGQELSDGDYMVSLMKLFAGVVNIHFKFLGLLASKWQPVFYSFYMECSADATITVEEFIRLRKAEKSLMTDWWLAWNTMVAPAATHNFTDRIDRLTNEGRFLFGKMLFRWEILKGNFEGAVPFIDNMESRFYRRSA